MITTSAAIIVFCKSGARAKTAKDALDTLGYTKVSILDFSKLEPLEKKKKGFINTS